MLVDSCITLKIETRSRVVQLTWDSVLGSLDGLPMGALERRTSNRIELKVSSSEHLAAKLEGRGT